MNKFTLILLAFISQLSFSETSMMQGHPHKMSMSDHGGLPVGLMGANMHHHGFMFSIKHSYMGMKKNILDGNDISISEILSINNPLGTAPPYLSVVPSKMNMRMTMMMGMYAISKNFNLTVAAEYTSKEMTLNTYKPAMDRDLVGIFSTSSSDLSGISFGSLILLKDINGNRTHLNVSIGKSLGNNEVKGSVLTPMGSYMEMTLPYAMQLGDRSIKMDLGLNSLKKINNKISWGNQMKRTFSLSNKAWSLGDKLEFNTWVQYKFNESAFFSSRLRAVHQQKISGINTQIKAPIQTANPANYGGKQLHFALGVSFLSNLLPGENNRIGIEFNVPIRQKKNGLQMKTKNQFTVGYQKSF